MEEKLTFGQRMVGLNFNPSEGEIHGQVHIIKQHHADVIDNLVGSDIESLDDLDAMARWAVELQMSAQMAAVKLATFPGRAK